MRRKPRPDGIFAYNDRMAIGAMNAILDAGLRIPQDIALVGSGNLHYDDSLRVPLSSIDQHSSMIGERTGGILLRFIESKVRPQTMSVILDPSLVVRSSSMRIPVRRPHLLRAREAPQTCCCSPAHQTIGRHSQ